MKIQKSIPVCNYQSAGFTEHYQKLVRDTVIPYQYEVLWDRVDGVAKSHVVQNFINAGKVLRGEDPGDGFYGMVFQDSDAAKWLEAVAYALSNHRDPEWEAKADELISYIAAAQDSDGYLNTYYTIKDREKRWTNLLEGHELYCAGHMMEAAVAYYEATGKDLLLNVMLKNAAHIYDVFVTNQHPGYPGHPEVEQALLRLYRATGDEKCLTLAEHFLNVRGVDTDFYRKERDARDWTVWGNNADDNEYQQSHCPVRDMSVATGHAVRAVYLYTGMADLAALRDDEALKAACERLWKNITTKQMYVTGGIGQTVHGEAFSKDYDLPGDTAYAETCASIGLMMFASRMLEMNPNAEYADVMELAYYNTVLAGMDLAGKHFFYVNPLEVIPGISGEVNTQRHDLPERPGWYACACCPPNLARTVTSFGRYAYGENADTAFCHLFAAGTVSFQNGITLTCETEYPYDFTIRYQVQGSGKLAIRIPGWSGTYSVTRNENTVTDSPVDGYLTLAVTDGDVVVLTLDGTPKYVYASSRVPRLTGKVSILRGPLVYCFEGKDNKDNVLELKLDTTASPKVGETISELGATALTVSAVRSEDTDSLYSFQPPVTTPETAVAVPYYTWGNRGRNQMRVWMDVK